jgi:hypothetical protein
MKSRLPFLLWVTLLSFGVYRFSSFLLFIIELGNSDSTNGLRRLFYLLIKSEKMIVLVILYCINNILSYVALGKVDAALYTVLSQVRVPLCLRVSFDHFLSFVSSLVENSDNCRFYVIFL